jgi:hypothetical protein
MYENISCLALKQFRAGAPLARAQVLQARAGGAGETVRFHTSPARNGLVHTKRKHNVEAIERVYHRLQRKLMRKMLGCCQKTRRLTACMGGKVLYASS